MSSSISKYLHDIDKYINEYLYDILFQDGFNGGVSVFIGGLTEGISIDAQRFSKQV